MSEQESTVTLDAMERSSFGKKNKALRRGGFTPLNLYGNKEKSVALQADSTVLTNAIRTAGRTKLVLLSFGDKKVKTIVRDVALHPVKDTIVHVDFMRVGTDTLIDALVPIRLNNTHLAPVTRGSGFNIVQTLRRFKVRAKADALPQSIEIDCGAIAKPSERINVGDIKLPSNVMCVSSPSLLVVSVKLSRSARAAESSEKSDEPGDNAPEEATA